MQLDTRLPLMAGQRQPMQFAPESQLQTLSRIAPGINALRGVQQQQQTQQQEMQRMMQRSAALDEMRRAIQDEDLGKYAQALINSGDQDLMQKGAQLQMADLQDKQFRRQYGGLTSNLTPEGMAELAGAGQKGLGLAKELGNYVVRPQPFAVGKNVYVPGQGFEPPPAAPDVAPQPQVLRRGDILVDPTTGERVASNVAQNALMAGAASGAAPSAAPATQADGRSRYLQARGFEVGPDGTVRPIPGGPADPETIRRQAEARRAPPPGPEGTPAQQARAEGQRSARDMLSQELSTVMGYYEGLNRMGAMTSPSRAAAANVAAAARATGVGQTAERFLGTEAQTLRDNISNARLRILNHVKNATGATAAQMNSNVELQTWLNALTNPQQSIETVRETLGQMDAVLGSVRNQIERERAASRGGAAPAPAPAPAAATGRVPAPAPGRAPAAGVRREVAPGVFVTERP